MSEQSLRSRLLEVFLRVSGRKQRAHKLRQRLARGSTPDHARPMLWLYAKHRIQKREMFGHTVWTMAPATQASQHHILFLHGGAYVNGLIRKYWRFLDILVDELKCTVVAPEYPLAPRYHVGDVASVVLTLYRELGASVGGSNITVIGTSSGGGIALAMAQRLEELDIPEPARLILISPWLDISMRNPDISKLNPLDPMLDAQGLRDVGALYAGDTAPTDPRVSPLYGRLTGLPPITLFIGTHDVMLADCRRLRVMMKAQGLSLDYREYPGMVHEWMLWRLPEAKAALQEIVEVIRRGGNHSLRTVPPLADATPAPTRRAR